MSLTFSLGPVVSGDGRVYTDPSSTEPVHVIVGDRISAIAISSVTLPTPTLTPPPTAASDDLFVELNTRSYIITEEEMEFLRVIKILLTDAGTDDVRDNLPAYLTRTRSALSILNRVVVDREDPVTPMLVPLSNSTAAVNSAISDLSMIEGGLDAARSFDSVEECLAAATTEAERRACHSVANLLENNGV